MRVLDARDLALIADALPWFARHLSGLADRTRGDERRAYRERAIRAWEVAEKVRSVHVEAVANARFG